MAHKLRGAAAVLAAGATVAGIGYLGAALWASRLHRRRRDVEPPPQLAASVTILKPLYGVDEDLFENLCSFCEQDFTRFQVVFGVHDASDPAALVVQRVIARYPEHDLVLATGDGGRTARNPKVANLLQMMPHARHAIVVIADSDMRVGRDYLKAVVAPFADAGVGAVTCLYSGTATWDLPSQLAAMFVNEQFAPSVLVAGMLEPLRYCFGATMAVRRDVLESIGGLEALGDRLADDHRLGELVTERGLTVSLAPYVVENVLHEEGFASLWSRELRWSRTIRTVRPAGYAFSFVTFGLPLALLAGTLLPPRLRYPLVAITALLRGALHLGARDALGARGRGNPLLIPIRDTLSFAVWAAGLFGGAVRWRGADLQVDDGGALER